MVPLPTTEKKARTSQNTPLNCFHANGFCAAHQCHRCIAARENSLIGNVHAIAYAAANPHLQSKLQCALKAILDETLVYARGAPTAENERLNKLVVKRTLRRRPDCIISEPNTDSVDGDAAVTTFLRFWNGDWSRPVVEHCCIGAGCCAGPEDAKQHLYAAAIAVDLLQSRDVAIPSADDWGSCGEAVGRSACGILAHNILHQAFERALPNWDEMLPNDRPEGEAPNDDADINGLPARLKVQKKAWRARCVLRDATKSEDIVLMAWMGSPVERLISVVQHLDSAGKGLFDAVLDTDLNPFRACRKELAELVHQGAKGPMEPVFARLPPHEHARVLGRIRALGLDFGGQVFWRFLGFSDFPYLWARYVHPGVEKESQDEVARHFFEDLNPCCRNREFSQKLHEYFEGDMTRLMNDENFRRAMLTWANAFLFTDMYS